MHFPRYDFHLTAKAALTAQGALTSWPSCERGPSVPCVSFDQMCYDVMIAVRIFFKTPLRDPRISGLPPLRRGSFGTTRQRIFLAVCVFPLQGAFAPGYEPGDSRSSKFDVYALLLSAPFVPSLYHIFPAESRKKSCELKKTPENPAQKAQVHQRFSAKFRSFLILTRYFSVFSACRSPGPGTPPSRSPPRGGRRRGYGSPFRGRRRGRSGS